MSVFFYGLVLPAFGAAALILSTASTASPVRAFSSGSDRDAKSQVEPHQASPLVASGTGDLRGPISAESTNRRIQPDNSDVGSGTTSSQSQSSNTGDSGITPPKVGPAENNTANQAAASLRGLANIASVTATATAMPRPPFARLRDPDLQFVLVTLRNDSQQVAVINGDACEATTGTGSVPAVGGRYLVESARPGLTKDKVATVVAATVGSAALAGPIAYEFVTPGQHRDRSLGEAIGVDGTRHQVEADRFGVRVLMPGDETVGWMSFATQEAELIRSVTIPISFSRSLTPDGVLEVPVSNGAAGVGVPQASVSSKEKAAQKAMLKARESAQDSGAPKPRPGEDSMMQDQTLPAGSGQVVAPTVSSPPG